MANETIETLGREVRDIPQVSPKEALELMMVAADCCKPILMLGAPGIGKTDLSRQLAEKRQEEYVLLPPAVALEPPDTRGLPNFVRRRGRSPRTEWAVPAFFESATDLTKNDVPMIIANDEFCMAEPSVQGCFFQILYGGTLGDLKFRDKITWILCGNRPEDKAGARKVLTALNNRVLVFELVSCVKDWAQWCYAQGEKGEANEIHQDVISWVKWKGDSVLNTFNPKTAQMAYATPRSWVTVSTLLKSSQGASDRLMRNLVGAAIGVAGATEFCAFLDLHKRLPDPDEILAHPKTAQVLDSKEASLHIALCSALIGRMLKLDHEGLERAMCYINRLQAEYGAFIVKDVACRNRSLYQTKQAGEWLRKHASLMVD